MKAMVMAAGLGTRLRPLTDFLPKPMMPVANRPVLHHLLNLLRRHDVREVGINLHAFPEMIEKYFGDGSSLDMSIRWSPEPELLGTAGGTKKLEDFWGDETILVTSGDGLHDIDVTALLGHHRRTGALATLTVKPVTDPSSYGVVILDRDTRIRGFQEKPTRDEARSDLANCGVYVIEPELLERIPSGTLVDFGTDIWPSLVAANEEIYAYTTMAYWNDVGDLDELRNTILDAVLGHVRIDVAGDEISPGVWAEADCRIADSARLDGPIVLGPNVVIEEGAQVRGPAAILSYLRDSGGSKVGHSPIGALSVLGLLGVVALMVATGLVQAEREHGEWIVGPLAHLVSEDISEAAHDLHELLFNVLLGLIGLHIAAILFYRLVLGKALVGAMMTGSGTFPEGTEPMRRAPLWRLIICILLSLAVTSWIIGGAPALWG